ncbi:unnamed protein product [Rotaria sp. Silwood1]|nr:unnamed protein product [Rotaria sp. Silwood1]CAF1371932.1 unnamed protein product [Rotaria sp. Silwood1]CAF3516110.1 unnamed protein product [Rotaria sp. Silwood1]CAF3600773.1 unnamed protein product [Rotaria sp. Silwood1]CAF4684516.1 unnamed protein product [Rotaria sp. Silwood1]
MRVLTALIIFLLVLQGIFADNCECSCCTSANCEPQVVGSFYTWYCDPQTCVSQHCIDRYHAQCPPVGANGKIKTRCSGTERLLSPLFIIIGITSIILMIKNKF